MKKNITVPSKHNIEGMTVVTATLFGGVSLYALAATGLIVFDIWLKLFS